MHLHARSTHAPSGRAWSHVVRLVVLALAAAPRLVATESYGEIRPVAQKVDIDVSYGRVGEIIREFRPLIANTPARGIRNNLGELTNCDNFNAPNFICAIELAEHELVNRWIPEGAKSV